MVYHPVSWQECRPDSFEGRVEARHSTWPGHGQSYAADYYGCAEHGSATNDGNGILATHDDATANDDANVAANDDADAAAHDDGHAATSDDDGHVASNGHGHGPTYALAAATAAATATTTSSQTRAQAPDPVLSNPAIAG